MRMDPQDIRDHSKFYYYVSANIPQVREMPFIINALKRFSGNSSEKAIKDALLWNKGPMIKLVDGLVCAGVKALGCYAVNSDIIRVEKKTVELFEAGKDLRHTATGKLVYLVGVTLLHELCHWANDGTGAEDLTHAKFEQALYGKVIV
jgi:Metallopeptidase toxin 3